MNRALATVDLGAVRHNVAWLKSQASGSALMAVVKANGYGHGAAPVARACIEAGADCLGVATAAEGRELREAGLDGRLIILGPLSGPDLEESFGLNAEILVWSYPFLKDLVHLGHARGQDMRVHVKLDTGMHRLGLYPQELPEYLDAIETEPEVELAGVMTHFATADEDDDFFDYQLRAFEDAVQVVLRTGTKVEFHCANSAATVSSRESHFDMVRCGIAIYGLSPFALGSPGEAGENPAAGASVTSSASSRDEAARHLRPALRLTSYLADIKPLKEGDSVGYGRAWMAGSDTKIGIVPIGYGDGISRRLSNVGKVLVGGKHYPIVGRVSMDQITVDLGPETPVGCGDEVVLIGSQGGASISAEQVALMLDTINYEITCNISSRVERRYSE